MVKKYQHLVLAGTFDHFHKGHKRFLNHALNYADNIYCGITTGWANENKVYKQGIQAYKNRLKKLNCYLNNKSARVKIFPLNDPFGSAVDNNFFNAIAATPDTLSGVKAVNNIRKSKGLKPLPIILTDLVLADDKKKISSTRIRLGEINRIGFVYQQALNHNTTLFLPKNNRHYFKKPIGRLISGSNQSHAWAGKTALCWLKKINPSLIITVGDMATQSFLLNNIAPNLAVFDQRCQRQPINFNLHHKLRKKSQFFYQAINKPGTISADSIFGLKQIHEQLINKNFSGLMQIKGEEDLLVLPIILMFPLKTAVFYGQPDQGLVKILITEKIKSKALNLIKKFKP
ncbi:hypothetical protein A3J78_00215 [Candidatus Beckwithbacteria bacterium RBG_13_35_6]|uniref:Cytidyltransferase-like domain-containing protein n=1 Tax=Candidatus Beckwithbacteria bacterium RBG_13_35_6 TaxID=1797456 RepID=A0A1F5DE18_9BACT|nr:MAG: hypothetical protein A3J78_00215 [Candidatus Beckwithbacteria bacterium RBG_13_35_6]